MLVFNVPSILLGFWRAHQESASRDFVKLHDDCVGDGNYVQLTHNPKPVDDAPVISDVPTAVSGTTGTCVDPPRPSPQNTETAQRRTLWVLFRRLLVVILSNIIVAPFVHVAVHVV